MSAYGEWKAGMITDAEYAGSCREEEATHRAGHLREQLFHLLFKAKFKRLVELVYYQSVYGIILEISLLQMVQDTTWRTYYHLRRKAAHGAMLVHSRTSSVAGIGLGVAAQS